MTYVEHDPMQEILAKPLYVTSLELVLEFRPSEPAQGLRYALRYPPLRAGVTRYVAFLWEYYGISILTFKPYICSQDSENGECLSPENG
jgi:hypothetical protein